MFSAEPQVDETNEREFAFGGGQAGIPSELRLGYEMAAVGKGWARCRPLHAGFGEHFRGGPQADGDCRVVKTFSRGPATPAFTRE